MIATDIPPLVEDGPEFEATGLVHRYQVPAGPGPYPTVVLLHGRYGSEDVMWVFRRVIPRPWLQVAPRAVMPETRPGYSWLHQPPDFWPAMADFEPAVEALVNFLNALPRVYNADPDRLFLMGFSQGAAVALSVAFTRPGLVRGIASLVGFAPRVGDGDLAIGLDGLPVFMAVGTEDERIPLEQSLRSADILRQAGADLDYHQYPTGHKLTAEGMKDLQAWWLARS